MQNENKKAKTVGTLREREREQQFNGNKKREKKTLENLIEKIKNIERKAIYYLRI